jgi:hypothetical protein
MTAACLPLSPLEGAKGSASALAGATPLPSSPLRGSDSEPNRSKP